MDFSERAGPRHSVPGGQRPSGHLCQPDWCCGAGSFDNQLVFLGWLPGARGHVRQGQVFPSRGGRGPGKPRLLYGSSSSSSTVAIRGHRKAWSYMEGSLSQNGLVATGHRKRRGDHGGRCHQCRKERLGQEEWILSSAVGAGKADPFARRLDGRE